MDAILRTAGALARAVIGTSILAAALVVGVLARTGQLDPVAEAN